MELVDAQVNHKIDCCPVPGCSACFESWDETARARHMRSDRNHREWLIAALRTSDLYADAALIEQEI